MPNTRALKSTTRSGFRRQASPPPSTAPSASKRATLVVDDNMQVKKKKGDDETAEKQKKKKKAGKRKGKQFPLYYDLLTYNSCRKTSSKRALKDVEAAAAGLPAHHDK